jgi:hypothetical protein
MLVAMPQCYVAQVVGLEPSWNVMHTACYTGFSAVSVDRGCERSLSLWPRCMSRMQLTCRSAVK